VNAVMNLRVPQNSGNFLTAWRPVSFSRKSRFREIIQVVVVGGWLVGWFVCFNIAKFTKVT